MPRVQRGGSRGCPPGVICTDNSTLWLIVVVVAAVIAAAFWFAPTFTAPQKAEPPKVYVVQAPAEIESRQQVRPDLYPEPVMRYGLAERSGIPALASRGPVGPIQQVGILTGEGGSASSAAPDRTILPLYGRELDSRRGRWNYYTRTDGTNPVQVPVRFNNRVCDDDTNGCNEVYGDDSVHVPALGRSFKATIYRKTLF